MRVSVVICAYDIERLNDILEAVNSILEQRYPDYEILIVSDNNEDLVSRLHRNFDGLSDAVRILVCEEKGLSNARNLGIEQSRGEITAFIDDDALADREWLSNLIINYKDPTVVGVGGLIKPVWIDNRPKWFPEELDWIVGCTYKGHPERRCEVRNIIGCNMSFRKNVFEQIGLFENKIGRVGKKLLAGEETELCMRVLENKPELKIIYDPDAIVYHKVPKNRQNIKHLLYRAYGEGKSKAYIERLAKYRSSKNILSTEKSYVEHLIMKSIRNRTRRVLRANNISTNLKQIGVIVAMIFLVLIGYAIGSIRECRREPLE